MPRDVELEWEVTKEARRVYSMNEDLKEHEREVKSAKSALIEQMRAAEMEKVHFDFDSVEDVDEDDAKYFGKNITCSVVQRSSVVYDAPKVARIVEEKMGRTVRDLVIHRTYTVRDIRPLMEMAKATGMSASEFRELFDVEESVNEGQLSKLYEFGNVTIDDIADAVSVKAGEPYLSFRATKKKK